MNDAFAARVYPTILYVLDLRDRITTRRGREPNPTDELPRLKQYLGQLDSRGADQRDFELAKSALVYWIDEMLVNSDWSHASFWRDNTLERDLFDSRDRAWKFFDNAKSARSLGRPDALEVYFLAAALGFEGIYRGGEFRPPTDAPPPAAAPPSAPQKKPESPASKGDMISWFQDDNLTELGGDSTGLTDLGTDPKPAATADTWGLGISNPKGAPAPPPAGKASPRGNTPIRDVSTAAVRDLPPTLVEWAKPVLTQVLPGPLKPLNPSATYDSPRDPRPLRGSAALSRSVMLLVVTTLIAVGLLIVRAL